MNRTMKQRTLNYTLNQIDLTNIYRILYLTTVEYIFFSSELGLGYKKVNKI